MVTYLTMVPDMITTPKYYVIAYIRKWLEGVIFKDKTIISYFIFKTSGLGTQIAYHLKPFTFNSIVNFLPKLIHIFWRHRCKKRIFSVGIIHNYIFK